MSVDETAIVVRAEEAVVKSLTVEGWVLYDAADPEAYPFINVSPVGSSYRPSPPKAASETTIVRRIRIVVPL